MGLLDWLKGNEERKFNNPLTAALHQNNAPSANNASFNVDVPGFGTLSLPSEADVPARRAYNSARWHEELKNNPGVSPEDERTWTQEMRRAHAENNAFGGGGLNVDYNKTMGQVPLPGVNPRFSENHPTINKALSTLSQPVRNVMDTPWIQRAGQSGAEVMTMQDNPDKASTGSKAGDLAADLAGGVMGFTVNPNISSGAKVWKAGENLIEQALPLTPKVGAAVAKAPQAVQSAIKIGAASVPFEATRAFTNDRNLSAGEAAKAAGANALLDLVFRGASKGLGTAKSALGNKTNIPEEPANVSIKERLNNATDEALKMPAFGAPEVSPVNIPETPLPKAYRAPDTYQQALDRLNQGVEDVQNFLGHNDVYAVYPPGTPVDAALADIKAKTGVDLLQLASDVEAVQARGGLRQQLTNEAQYSRLGQAAGAIPQPDKLVGMGRERVINRAGENSMDAPAVTGVPAVKQPVPQQNNGGFITPESVTTPTEKNAPATMPVEAREITPEGIPSLERGNAPQGQASEVMSPQTAQVIEPTQVKEPWELTNQEFTQLNSHRQIVEQAIAEGKPVPAEVLAEYPDLSARVEPLKAEGAPGTVTPQTQAGAPKDTPSVETQTGSKDMAAAIETNPTLTLADYGLSLEKVRTQSGKEVIKVNGNTKGYNEALYKSGAKPSRDGWTFPAEADPTQKLLEELPGIKPTDLSGYGLSLEQSTTKSGNTAWTVKGDTVPHNEVLKRLGARNVNGEWVFYGKDPTQRIIGKLPPVKTRPSKAALPETTAAAETKTQPPEQAIDLPEHAVGATRLQLPDTMDTIASKTDKAPAEVKGIARRIYQRTIDSLNRLNDVDTYVEKTAGKKLAYKDKMYIQALNQKGADQTARFILEEGLRDSKDNVVGPSFKEVVRNVPSGKWRQFEDYLKLKHFKAWEKEGMEVYSKDLNMNEILADKKIAKYEKDNPWIKQAADDYTGWINQFGEKWLVDTGLVSKEAWDAMRTKYKDYIPFQRLLDETELGVTRTGAKRGFANQSGQVKQAQGSERKTIESIETMLERIPAYVKAARRNEVMQTLIKRMEDDPEGMAPWGEIITKETGNLNMPNIVAGRVNGERVHVKMTDPQLLEALTKLAPDAQNKVIEHVRQGTRIMKMLTTGVNPVFSLGRNIFRDLPTSYVASKSTNNPLTWAGDLVGAAVDIIGNKEMYKSYKSMGGGHSSSIAADRNLLAESKARIQPGYIDPKKPAQAAGRLAKKAGGALERLANVTETLPRLAEYRRNVRQGGGSYESKVKGLFEANDITTNFMRSGEISRTLDAFIPYFNAAVQGLDKFGRTFFKGSPQEVTAAWGKGIAAITVPALVLYAQNHSDPNYQKLSHWVKDNNFCIPKGDGTFIKVPKPRESGVILGAAVERVLQQWQDHDPDAFEKFSDTIKTSFVPPTRTIAAPFGDIRANKNFMGTPIVPGYMERLSPKEQYDETTSNPGKNLGKVLGVSPKYVDYIVRSYTGILGQLGIPAFSEGGNVRDTLARQFIADPVYSNDIVSKFYDAKNELDTAYNDAKHRSGSLTKSDEQRRKLYGKVGDKISNTRKQMRAIEQNKSMDPELKKAKLRAMQAAIVTMCEAANKK